jgi:hypothetical protein
MKALFAFVLLSQVAMAAAPNKKVNCEMPWDGETLTFEFSFSRPNRAKAILVLDAGSADEQRADLGAQVQLTPAGRSVGVGFFMGVLVFEFPAAIFENANVNRPTSVTVNANIAGDESSAQVTCVAKR